MAGDFQVLSLHDPSFKAQIYRRRREHQRARTGCLTCRAKRVKCDEQKPICKRCHRNDRQCAYHLSGVSHDSTGSIHRKVITVTSPYGARISTPILVEAAPLEASSRLLLHHFWDHMEEIFPIHQTDHIIEMSKTNTLVLNTVLATTASHLRRLSPEVTGYQVSEFYYQSLVIQNLRTALYTPREKLGQDGAKVLLMCAILLNMIAFTIPEMESEDPQTSWVFSMHDDRLNWFALQIGIRPMTESLGLYIENVTEFLGPIFLGGDKETWDFLRPKHDIVGIPEAWIQIFQLTDSSEGVGCEPASTGYSDLYRLAVITLRDARKLDPVRANIFRSLQFLSKVPLGFRDLLFKRDKRAMWLFGYWLGLMCRFGDVWWFGKRVARDYLAILKWLKSLSLDRLPGKEAANWCEMMVDLDLASTYCSF